ncbi:citrate synthase/methylcitrate synthase [Devosia sp. A16]|uniref:citrate synthase/methylcitrate synthase n=1 Tax=Devosia sp. A16 TaxID=1736675 RepID=UPI0006D7BEF9|nr:citrate synthase/methylcitrate synthase [Devosia sp. A16]
MSNGLEDIIAAETVLSDVDGLAGRLIIRGEPLAALAGRVGYEDVLSLLWDGFFPDLPHDLRQPLGAARARMFEMLHRELPLVANRSAFDAMRSLMALLPDGTDLDSALLLTAAPGVLLSALLRLRAGNQPLTPDTDLDHATDVLRMMGGAAPRPELARALGSYLVTVADHGLNASTFAARVVASTEAGLTSSVLAALGALKGPLHGGAPGPVLDMLDAVGKPENAEAWISAELARGERLMGFGHRIYRVRDPRADALKAALAQISGAVDTNRMALAAAVETAALKALKQHKPDRPLDTNVEFYTAVLLEAVGFPRDCFTAVFATGRVGGWIAHAREQAATGRLIRPKSRYIGPMPKVAA